MASSLLTEESTQTSTEPASEVRSVFRVASQAFIIFLVLYGIFWLLSSAFPYLQPGGDLVGEFKHQLARRGNPFQSPRGSRLHVMAFGYSKTLAGFVPTQFDSEMASAGYPNIESYNFGLPGDSRFVDDLEVMAKRGVAPDVALLTFPWPANVNRPTFFHFINDDNVLMYELFPFRNFVRNVLITALEGETLGGFERVYKESEGTLAGVERDRGYYFIVRQSRFPQNELPDNMHSASDTPNKVDPREVTLGPIYEKLAKTLAEEKIECIFVPKYYRLGEYAPAAPLNSATASTIADQPNLSIAGPDYWLYPNRMFSDMVHTNPNGAAAYTKDLANLFANWLRQHPHYTR